jgi:hypothetical protein
MTTKQQTVYFRYTDGVVQTTTLNVKDLDITFPYEGAEFKRTITKKLIPRKDSGFRLRVSFSYDFNIQNDKAIGLINRFKLLADVGTQVYEMSFDNTTWYNVVLDPSSIYGLNYQGQVITSVKPSIIVLSQELLSTIPTDFIIYQ